MKTQFTTLALLIFFVFAEVNAKTLSPPVIVNDVIISLHLTINLLGQRSSIYHGQIWQKSHTI